jgi:AraC-like DNA-binding protein
MRADDNPLLPALSRAGVTADFLTLPVFNDLLRLLEAQGIAPQRLLTLLHGAPERRRALQQPVAISAYVRVLQYACGLSTDPHLPLQLGAALRLTDYGLLGSLLMSAAQLKDAAHCLLRFYSLLGGTGEIAVHRAARSPLQVDWLWIWRPVLCAGQVLLAELTLSSWLSALRQLTGQPALLPSRVYFRHSAPQDLSEYQRRFGRHLVFDAPENALCLPESLLLQPLPQADSCVHPILLQRAERLLAEQRAHPPLLTRARRALQSRLGEVSLTELAESLQLSARTLQRRLHEQGLSFQQLLDEVRQRCLWQQLRTGPRTLESLIEPLGFGDQRSLERAFLRWSGQPLRDFLATLPFSASEAYTAGF